MISCPLCKWNTLWNIFMTLGRNVEQDKATCPIQEWQRWLSYFLRLYSLVLFLKLISCLLFNSNTLWNILMVFVRNIEQDETMISCPLPYENFYDTCYKCWTGVDNVSHTRMTTLVFLLLELSPLVLFELDFMFALLHEHPLEYFDDIW